MGSGNGIIDNINHALETWNQWLAEIWQILTMSPQQFRGGAIWSIMQQINSGLKGAAYGLLVLFFIASLLKNVASFRELKRPETAIRLLVKFIIGKTAVDYGMDILNAIYTAGAGLVGNVMAKVGGNNLARFAELSDTMKNTINGVDFWGSIPLFLISIFGTIIVTALSFVILYTVYGRFFRLFLHTAIAPIALSTAAGDGFSNTAREFLKSYAGVCLEGLIIIVSIVVFNAIASTPTDPTTTKDAFNSVFQYMTQVIFNMLMLVGLIKSADTVVKRMFGI